MNNNYVVFGEKRLDSIFIEKGFCTPRSSKNFFLKNEIFVNDIRITDKKFFVSNKDKILFQNKLIDFPEDIYLVVNKPKNIVCSKVSDSHETVFEWVKKEINNSTNSKLQRIKKLINDDIFFERLHSVGRLDSETTGLLILTTDGNYSHFITNPENKIKKTYLAILRDFVSSENQEIYVKKAAEGLLLPAEKKSPEEKSDSAEIEWISSTKCKITVTEGKFHEVRRIFRALGNEVTELMRISIGEIELGTENISILTKKL